MDGHERQLAEAYPFSDDDFRVIAARLYKETGICLALSKRPMVIARLSRRLRTLGMRDFKAYRQLIESSDGPVEVTHMISRLTTNVTRFFREDAHFDDLKVNVFPSLVQRAKTGARVRIWSAGCATGEEAYSLAFTLLSVCPEAADLDIKILATDIDPVVVQTGIDAQFQRTSISKLPQEIIDTNFRSVPNKQDVVQVAQKARDLITFRVLNLIGDWPFSGMFDVILCRNVVIYFDAVTQNNLWQRFADYMSPNARLYIGHSERLSQDAMSYFRPLGTSHYKRADIPTSQRKNSTNSEAIFQGAIK